MSSANNDFNNDPSLNAKDGFYRANGDDKPMIITADFGALTRITEVILKKYNHSEADKEIVKKFKLEHKSNDKWLHHGEYETDIMEEDDRQKAHHIKLE